VEKLRKALEKKNADFQLREAGKRSIRQGCSAQDFVRWQAHFGGMQALSSERQRLKAF
jgi:hypothetical protein